MDLIARLSRGFGNNLIMTDEMGIRIGEMLWNKRFFNDVNAILKNSTKDRKGRVVCSVMIDENGFRVDVRQHIELENIPQQNPDGSITTTTEFVPITPVKRGKGRPKGAKNKPKKEITNENTSQTV